MDGSARSLDGGIQVKTTERGLPVALKLDGRQTSRPPMELAADILALCQLSARRLQVARRHQLQAQGVSLAVIRGLHLSTVEELERSESELWSGDEDAEPGSWMTPA